MIIWKMWGENNSREKLIKQYKNVSIHLKFVLSYNNIYISKYSSITFLLLFYNTLAIQVRPLQSLLALKANNKR